MALETALFEGFESVFRDVLHIEPSISTSLDVQDYDEGHRYSISYEDDFAETLENLKALIKLLDNIDASAERLEALLNFYNPSADVNSDGIPLSSAELAQMKSEIASLRKDLAEIKKVLEESRDSLKFAKSRDEINTILSDIDDVGGVQAIQERIQDYDAAYSAIAERFELVSDKGREA